MRARWRGREVHPHGDLSALQRLQAGLPRLPRVPQQPRAWPGQCHLRRQLREESAVQCREGNALGQATGGLTQYLWEELSASV